MVIFCDPNAVAALGELGDEIVRHVQGQEAKLCNNFVHEGWVTEKEMTLTSVLQYLVFAKMADVGTQ